MLKALSIRNAKRQARDYLIYFVTMISAAALIYAFNTLIFSEAIARLVSVLTTVENVFNFMIIFASILIIFILSWLVKYIMQFMLRKRSQELSTYMILGIEKKDIIKLFFLENAIIGGTALIIGLVFGVLISQILEAVVMNLLGDAFHFSMELSPYAIGLTVFYFILIFWRALRKCQKKLRSMKLYNLLYYEKMNEAALLKDRPSAKYLFIVSILCGIAGILFLVKTPFGKGYDILLGLILLILFLLGFFICLSGFLTALLGSDKEWKYKKNHLFIYRTLTAKVGSISITLAMVSILFTLTLVAVGVGIAGNLCLKRTIELSAFDFVILHLDEEYDFSQYTKSFDEQLVLDSSHTYQVYTGSDSTLTDLRIRTLSKEPNTGSFLLNEFIYDTYMKYSDYSILREMLGLEPVEMPEGSFLIHCLDYLKEPYENYYAETGSMIFNETSLKLNGIYSEDFNQYDGYGNGMDFIIILPDNLVSQFDILYSLFAAIAKEPRISTQLRTIVEVNDNLSILNRNFSISSDDMRGSTLFSDREQDYIEGKTALSENNLTSYAFILSLIYLAFVLCITGAVILATQLLSDSKKYQKQYEMLEIMGLTRKKAEKILLKQLFIFYLIPAVPSIALGVAILWIFIPRVITAGFYASIMPTYQGVALVAITVGLFAIIYGIYCYATYILLKRDILPE